MHFLMTWWSQKAMSVSSNPIQQVTNEDEILPQRWLLIILLIIKLQSFLFNFQGGSYQASCCKVGGIKKVSSSSHHWVCNTTTITTSVVVWISSVLRWKGEINRQNSLRIFTVCHSKLNFRLSLLAWLAQRRHHITQLTRITKVLPLSFKWIMNNELKGKNQSIISLQKLQGSIFCVDGGRLGSINISTTLYKDKMY